MFTLRLWNKSSRSDRGRLHFTRGLVRPNLNLQNLQRAKFAWHIEPQLQHLWEIHQVQIDPNFPSAQMHTHDCCNTAVNWSVTRGHAQIISRKVPDLFRTTRQIRLVSNFPSSPRQPYCNKHIYESGLVCLKHCKSINGWTVSPLLSLWLRAAAKCLLGQLSVVQDPGQSCWKNSWHTHTQTTQTESV